MPSYDTEPWKETEQCFDHREDVQALRAQWHNVDFNSVEFDGIKIGHYVVDVKEE
jgi:hypothetical protein